MRRKDRAVEDREEIKKMVEACGECSLAFNGEEYPYVIPINFGEVWDGEKVSLYFHCAKEGEKIERMKRDNRVSFSMYILEELKIFAPACKSTIVYSSVCGIGRLESVEEKEEKIRGLDAIMRHLDKKTEHFEFNEKVVEQTAVLKLTVEQITAKSSRPR